MINVTKPSMPLYEEYCEEIKTLWDSHWITNMGEKHVQFEKMLTEFLSVDNVGLLVNGHMAIEMSLQAMDLKGEVITTPFTFASTTHAIVRNGLTPVFCDIKANDFTIDTDKIEELITPNTAAILPVHVYGNICDVKSIDRIAQKHNLKVIYDAAHAFGESVNGVPIGNFGDASCFSFHATKAFNSIEGGAVTYRDGNFGRRLYELKNFGIHGTEEILGIGANAKLNEFCAAMGICNLRHFSENLSKRESLWRIYKKQLSNIAGLTINIEAQNVKSNYSYFPIVIDEDEFGISRDKLQELLLKKGIYARKYFYPLTSEFDCYKGMFNSSRTPVALQTSRRVLTLPLYADLEEEQVNYICDVISDLHINNSH